MALRALAALPWRYSQQLGAALGWLMFKLPNQSREVARINLSKCFPELSESERNDLLRRSLMDTGRWLTESAHAWLRPAAHSLEQIREVQGLEVLQQALASGKGVVGITSHLGNWEVLNHFYCNQCSPVVFYRPAKIEALDKLLKKQRVQLGNQAAPSTLEGIRLILKTVRNGGAVGIPADPEPTESAGFFVPFLQAKALTSKFVPSMLTGGKALGVFLHALRLPDGAGFKVILEAAPKAMYSEDLEQATAAMSEVLASYVRRYPSQYMWTMKRFKKRPQSEARWY